MRKKKGTIGILYRKDNTRKENKTYQKAITKFNGIPIMIDKDNINKLNNCQGLVITGGYMKEELDDVFIQYALEHKLPLLGICQGMQSMAIFGSDLKLEEIGHSHHHQKEGYVHKVLLKESRLKQILKKGQIKVNSYHYQTVKKSNYFQVVGVSEDQLIEAIENPHHSFQIGVQWHPERMLDYDEDANTLFYTFIKECSKTK